MSSSSQPPSQPPPAADRRGRSSFRPRCSLCPALSHLPPSALVPSAGGWRGRRRRHGKGRRRRRRRRGQCAGWDIGRGGRRRWRWGQCGGGSHRRGQCAGGGIGCGARWRWQWGECGGGSRRRQGRRERGRLCVDALGRRGRGYSGQDGRVPGASPRGRAEGGRWLRGGRRGGAVSEVKEDPRANRQSGQRADEDDRTHDDPDAAPPSARWASAYRRARGPRLWCRAGRGLEDRLPCSGGRR